MKLLYGIEASLSHMGEEFVADANGIIDLPDHVAVFFKDHFGLKEPDPVPTKEELVARAEKVGLKLDLRKPLEWLIAKVVSSEQALVKDVEEVFEPTPAPTVEPAPVEATPASPESEPAA